MALVAALAAWVPACGGKEEAANAPATGGGAPAQELASVDPADVAGYDAWLKANGLEAPEVSLSGHRGGGSEVSAWPLLPRGEVRLDGLTVWRLEVDLDNFDPEAGGVLEFRKGKNVLWRDSVPFQPNEMRIVQGGLPKSVLDAVKVGDVVTWGIAYEKQPKRSMMGEFKVVNKPAAAKQIDRIENDRLNARQPAKVKALGRAQTLLNNSLYAEALHIYMELAVGTGNDPTVQEAGYRIVECMRRLGLDEAPLYSDAMKLAGARKGKRMGAAGTEGDPPAGLPIVVPYVAPNANPLPEPSPQPSPTPPAPPPGGSGRKPTSEQARRAVAAIDKQAEKAAASAKAAEERVRALAQKGAPDAAMIAALRAAADAAKGTAGEAQARLALETALAKQGQAEQARRQAEDAQNDPRLLELARRLAEAGAEPAPAGGPAPVAPAGSGRLGPMSEEAERAMAQANGLSAEAQRLLAVAEQAGKDGGEGAENLLRQAQEAERKAQEAMEHAHQLQKLAERELLGQDQPSGTPAVKPPSQEEQVRAFGDWARRLEEEARGLADGVNDLEAQARAAEAAGDPERAIALRDQMPEQKEAARIAMERSAAAQEALRALMQALGREGR